MKLHIGNVYFIVLCADENLRIPVIQTLVYAGERTRGNGESFLCFREKKPHDEESLFSVEHEYADDLLVDGAGLMIRLKEYLNNPNSSLR